MGISGIIRARWVQGALILLAAIVAATAVGAERTAAAEFRSFPGIEFKVASSQPTRNKLDVYVPQRLRESAPVVVWVHGGAWYQGNKNGVVADKAARFTRAGYVFVATNYRLSPRLEDPDSFSPNRVMFPDHPVDVADAIGWVDRNISAYGGDPERIMLMGHSAGGQIVSLLGTDHRYLARVGVSRDQIKGVISLDAVGFDIPALVDPADPTRGSLGKPGYWNAFGTPAENLVEDRWRAASPIEFAGPNDPPFLFVVPDDVPVRIREATRMANRLGQRPGHAIFRVSKTHREINHHFGSEDDRDGETVRSMAFAHAVTRGDGPVRAFARARSKRFVLRARTGLKPVVVVAGSRPVGARLHCRLDRGPVHDCAGRRAYRTSPGVHRLKIRAYDFNGRLGPVTTFRFRVVKKMPG